MNLAIFQAVNVQELEDDEARFAVEIVVGHQSFTVEHFETNEEAEWHAGQLRIALHSLLDMAVGDALEKIVEWSAQDVKSDVGFVALGKIERAARELLGQIRGRN